MARTGFVYFPFSSPLRLIKVLLLVSGNSKKIAGRKINGDGPRDKRQVKGDGAPEDEERGTAI